jgi:nitrate reductase gamma subunit
MGLIVSLAAVTVLVIIGLLGANVPYIFGVVIPYIAIAIFIFGIIYRIIKWARSPVPFRITTTSGQQKSLDWIKQNKLDSPSSTLGVIGRMALEVLFFRSLFRNTKTGLKEGKKLVYSEETWLWLGGLIFHWSFLLIFLRHFRFFSDRIPSFVPFLQNIDGFLQVGVPIIYITNVLIIAAVTFLFLRRLFDARVRYISLSSDYFPLLLILGIAVTGILMRYFTKVDLVGIKEMVVGVLTFNPIVKEGISSTFYLHLFLVCTLLIYFPMSKLMHMPGVFMSPTRNLANNNRMKRHINPWNPQVHVHTYEEYEDEFRDVMIGAGLPVDKEAKDVN